MESDSLLPTDFNSDLQSFRKKRRKACVFILVSQFFERTAYYAVYANLILFLNTDPLHWSSYNAMSASLILTGVTYVTCLLGGILAEACLNKHKLILMAYVVYLTGYALLTISFFRISPKNKSEFIIPSFCSNQNNSWTPINETVPIGEEICSEYLISAVSLIGIGGGLIKAVIVPFGADQIRYEVSSMVRTFFNSYYWVVNSGSFISYLIFAYIQQNVNAFYGYIVPFFLLGLSTLTFVLGIPFYNCRNSSINSCQTLCSVCRESCWRRCCLPCRTKRLLNKRNFSKTVIHSNQISTSNNIDNDSLNELSSGHWSINFLDLAKVRYGGSHHESTVEDIKIFGKILAILACFIPFWIVYFQMESAFMVQGLHMKLDVDIIKNIKIPAAWLTLFDVITILLFLPIMDRLVYPWLDRRNKSLSLHSRMAIGMVFSLAAVLLGGVVETFRKEYVGNNTMSQNISGTTYYISNMPISCQIPQYVLTGFAEIFASVAGLEFAYRHSPKSMQSLINGIFFFVSGVGSFLGIGIVNSFQHVWFRPNDHGNINCGDCHLDFFFYFLGGLQAAGIIVFLFVSRKYPVKSLNSCLPSINTLNSNLQQNVTSSRLGSTVR